MESRPGISWEKKREDFRQILHRMGPFRLGAIILCGIVLLFLSCGGMGAGTTKSTSEEQAEFTEEEEYREQMRTELMKLLGQVEGVGKVQVMLNLRNEEDEEPRVAGVAVVCDGGDNMAVKREITEAVSALFQLESHKIKVMKSKEAKE